MGVSGDMYFVLCGIPDPGRTYPSTVSGDMMALGEPLCALMSLSETSSGQTRRSVGAQMFCGWFSRFSDWMTAAPGHDQPSWVPGPSVVCPSQVSPVSLSFRALGA